MTIEELRKIRLASDYKEMLRLRESEIIDWEITRGEPPYVEEYLLTLDISTYSEKDTLFSPVKIKITLPEKYPMMHPMVRAEGIVPFHPYWYTSGKWSCGVFEPTGRLAEYCIRMIRELLYDPTVLGTETYYLSCNMEAAHWYDYNHDDASLFPCDRQKLEEVKAIEPHLYPFIVVKSKT